MTEKRTIYAVSDGCYSDYHVLALFEDEEDAEAYRAATQSDEVEEFAFYPSGCRERIVTIYTAEWHPKWYASEDAMTEPHMRSRVEIDDAKGTLVARYRRPVAEEVKKMELPSFSAQCLDREAAIKSVMDRAAAWRARTFPA